MTTIQSTKYPTFFYFFLFLARNFGSAQGSIKTPSRPAGIPHLCNSATLHLCNSNIQNEPNGMLFKPHSKPKNRLFGNFTKPFYAKRTQWYVIY